MRSSDGLVVGAGEVGTALRRVLHCWIRDTDWGDDPSRVGMLHVTFPWTPSFVSDVLEYQARYQPHVTVVHSTVPVGTSRAVGGCHSPIRGVHPHLEEGIRTFTKFFAGEGAEIAAAVFAEQGVTVEVVEEPEETEAGKLWELAHYGLVIRAQKAIYQWCQDRELDPEVVYRRFAETYNEGYAALGMGHVVRPVIRPMPGDIGGHCVLKNARHLDHQIGEIVTHGF